MGEILIALLGVTIFTIAVINYSRKYGAVFLVLLALKIGIPFSCGWLTKRLTIKSNKKVYVWIIVGCVVLMLTLISILWFGGYRTAWGAETLLLLSGVPGAGILGGKFVGHLANRQNKG